MMPVLHVLKKGDRGPRVAELQRALERRGIGRGLGRLDDDGDLGPTTWAYWERAYEALGGKPGTFDGGTTRAKRRYRLVRFPGLRTPLELARAARWKPNPSGGTGAAAALAFGRQYLGKTEHPSNRGTWGLNAWQSELAGGGSWLNAAPWCGIYVWACLTKGAGVKGLTSRCAAVAFIYADAAAGRNGWRSRHARDQGRPGDAVILFGTSTHVGLIEKRVVGGYQTLEGNTSPGTGGSQSNGGGCYRRVRPYSAVVACCRPNHS